MINITLQETLNKRVAKSSVSLKIENEGTASDPYAKYDFIVKLETLKLMLQELKRFACFGSVKILVQGGNRLKTDFTLTIHDKQAYEALLRIAKSIEHIATMFVQDHPGIRLELLFEQSVTSTAQKAA
ncbi:MAG: hypothetical protein A3C84_04785 [Candidatus Ryanbacteria bacterium RIFCSPHIGHO2_02_FULL_48_12]|uniref:Uncharacterized protein n=1 Tax=Candidatus Ryanbacteria bacterium RIFCSPHIGHO2_01_FULL_48_27 TaxID=1802115 RepID=A0A1G2G5L8_9BACT|nr:MAG: hypothetical protein A2756_00940 [Candidatus Ryanbacteria bacterium RIFCSPHIGHO2_01_FULL_48_27]OGZ48367.1 MAG: hypothetical protein A3C84_04785 [Candidatus Ryanbacteria bacterium RIFCSPHIGHO2_02_FULL_48_12]